MLTIPSLTEKGTRRNLLVSGMMAGMGGFLGLSVSPTMAQEKGDVDILNGAIDQENQAIWAYTVAAPKLTTTDVGKKVLSVATQNLKDHEQHRTALADAVKSLGGTAPAPKDTYDLSFYIDGKEGGLDSDANIAKLALALEYDAALAYISAFSLLSKPELIAAAGTIGPNEVAHVTAIRAVFHSLDPSIKMVPSAFVSSDTRSDWILKV